MSFSDSSKKLMSLVACTTFLASCATHTGLIELGSTNSPTAPGTYYTQVKTRGGVDGRVTALDVKRCEFREVCAQGCNDPLAIELGTFAMTNQLVCESQLAVVTSPGIVNEILTLGGAAVSSAVFGAVGAAVVRPPRFNHEETTNVQQTGGGARSQADSVSEGSRATSTSRARSRSQSHSSARNAPITNTNRPSATATATHAPTTTSHRSSVTNINNSNTVTTPPMPMPMPGGHND